MKSIDQPKGRKDEPVGSRRAWRTPMLTEYGHISKLTQGNSGMNAETAGMTVVKGCL